MTVVAEYVTKEHFDHAMERIDAQFVTKDHFDKSFAILVEMISGLVETVNDIKLRLIKLENDFEEMRQSHFALEEAEGKDAIATINHERRITRLEKRLKIIPDTPFHLLQPE